MSGVTDVQLALEYQVFFENSRLIASLGMNLPSGTNQLSSSAYETAEQLALAQYGFNVPHFGQGGSFAPGLAFVTSVTPNMIVSLGGTYRVRSSFEPISELADQYEWGNELMLTFGAGAELSTGLSLSADLIYTSYGEDKIGDVTVFQTGNQVVAQAQIHKNMNNQDIWLTGKYRTIDANEVLAEGNIQTELLKSFPGFAKVTGQYSTKLSPTFRGSVVAESTWYEEDAAFEALGVYSIGIIPAFSVTPAVTIPLHARMIFGDLSGYEVGVGITAIL